MLVASRRSLRPEGAAAPAARRSRFRGPCLYGGAFPRLSLRALHCFREMVLRTDARRRGRGARNAHI